MSKGLFVVGTDTDCGKTVVATALVATLKRQGMDVGIFKPLASGCESRGGVLRNHDVDQLMRAAGLEDDAIYWPLSFEEPLAPFVAAKRLQVKISTEGLLERLSDLTNRHDYMVVEGCGGVLVPITEKYSMLDFIQDSGLEVLIVGRTSLGTINHTLMTLELLRSRSIPVKGIILSQTSQQSAYPVAEETNPEIIRELSGEAMLGVLKYIPEWNSDLSELVTHFDVCCNVGEIIQ